MRRPRPSLILAGVIGLLALLYTLALFPGLEWYSGYFGFSYKALHPESFPGDKYMPAGNPTSLSTYYVLVRLVGDLWLDDRFTIGVFFALVILALLGVDRTARALGAEGLDERIVIVALLAIGHRFRDNVAMLVTNADFYAGTFAGVAAIWLLYWTLSGARLWVILAGVALLGSLNARWAWFPSLLALTVVARERLTPRQQGWVAAAIVGAGVVLGVVYASWLRPPGPEQAWLFDDLLRRQNSEIHPFLDTALANLTYFLVLGLGLLLAVPIEAPRRRVRMVVLLGALLWVLGGLYLSYVPDLMKVPHLAALAPNRATQWPQYVLFLSMGVAAVVMLRAPSGRRRVGGLVVLAALYGTFSPGRMLKVGVVGAVLLGASLWWWRRGRVSPGRAGDLLREWLLGANLARVAAATLLLVTLGAFGKGTVQRSPDLLFLARHGVMGDHPSAKWVGVDEFVRRNTAPDATILPLANGDYRWRPGLVHEASLRIRTGRSTPMGPRSAVWFDQRLLQEHEVDGRHMKQMLEAWRRGDVETVERELAHFRPVDYIIVQESVRHPIQERLADYRVESSVGEFTILRRQPRRAGGRVA